MADREVVLGWQRYFRVDEAIDDIQWKNFLAARQD